MTAFTGFDFSGGKASAALPVFAGAVSLGVLSSVTFLVVNAAGEGWGVAVVDGLWEYAAAEQRQIRAVLSNAAFMMTFP
jgi:hypothetical protein